MRPGRGDGGAIFVTGGARLGRPLELAGGKDCVVHRHRGQEGKGVRGVRPSGRWGVPPAFRSSGGREGAEVGAGWGGGSVTPGGWGCAEGLSRGTVPVPVPVPGDVEHRGRGVCGAAVAAPRLCDQEFMG